jgi:hypothetical protein
MEPITLLILGGLALFAFGGKKKNGNGPPGAKTITWVLEDLMAKEQTAVVTGGDTILLKLPGLVENYGFELAGLPRPLDDLIAIEKLGQQGTVVVRFDMLGFMEPYSATVTVLGNGQRMADFHIDYRV